MVEFTLVIAAAALIMSVAALIRTQTNKDNIEEMQEMVVTNDILLHDVNKSLLELRKNFNAKVYEVLEEIGGNPKSDD